MLRKAIIASVLCAAAAHAGIEDFYGHWENTARDAGGLTHLVINPDGGNRVSIRAYGNCHPVECNWGLVQGKSYASDPHASGVDSILAVFNAGLARREIVLRVAARGRLSFEMLTEFPDGSGPRDFAVRGTLKQSAWAGPIAENWERPADSGSGWGGGVRSGASPKPEEACAVFDPASLRTIERNHKWVLAAGKTTLAEAADRRLVRDAEAAARYYRFDRKCSVGGAADIYWKRGTDFPKRKMGGIDCLVFNPTTVHAVRIGGGWKVVDGAKWLASLRDRKQADALLSLIRYHRLDTKCSVGQPDPILVYWLSS